MNVHTRHLLRGSKRGRYVNHNKLIAKTKHSHSLKRRQPLRLQFCQNSLKRVYFSSEYMKMVITIFFQTVSDANFETYVYHN